MNTVAYKLTGNLLISVHGREPVSAAQFPEILATFRRLDYATVRMLVITEGGGPTPQQRKEMTTALNGQQLLTAVVSDETMIRGIVTALSWFNSKIRSFKTSQIDEALIYLELRPSRFEEIKQEISNLRRQLHGTVQV